MRPEIVIFAFTNWVTGHGASFRLMYFFFIELETAIIPHEPLKTHRNIWKYTLESSNPSKLASVYGISVLTAGDCCNTDAFLLKSSAVSSLRRVQNNSTERSRTIEETRSVMARSAAIITSALSVEWTNERDLRNFQTCFYRFHSTRIRTTGV